MYNYQQNRNTPPDSVKKQYGPFFKEDGSLILDWVGEKAQKISQEISNAKYGLTATGLRNFYNEFLRIRNLPASHSEEKKILIKLLIAKVNYKKLTNKAPDIFAKFITELITEVGDDLGKFEKSCLIMEAVVGFNPKK